MIHPLIKLLASRPELLAGHIAGYGQLVAVQASEAATQLRVRAWLAGAVFIGAGVGLGLGGMALLLAASLPLQQMPMPWLLVAVPAAPLLLAAVCTVALQQRPAAWSLDQLRDQLAADAEMLSEVSAS